MAKQRSPRRSAGRRDSTVEEAHDPTSKARSDLGFECELRGSGSPDPSARRSSVAAVIPAKETRTDLREPKGRPREVKGSQADERKAAETPKGNQGEAKGNQGDHRVWLPYLACSSIALACLAFLCIAFPALLTLLMLLIYGSQRKRKRNKGGCKKKNRRCQRGSKERPRPRQRGQETPVRPQGG